MQYTYNLYSIETLFRQFLISGIKKEGEKTIQKIHQNTLKNYLSDLRHFLGWLISHLSRNFQIDDYKIHNEIISFVNEKNIQSYKMYLLQNRIPLKTINRRLSTLRKFCFFCVLRGFLKHNPTQNISNVDISFIHKQSLNKNINYLEIIYKFEGDFSLEKYSKSQIKVYIDDIKEFLKQTVTADSDIISSEKIKSYIQKLVEKNISIDVIKRNITSLAKFIFWLQEKGYIKNKNELLITIELLKKEEENKVKAVSADNNLVKQNQTAIASPANNLFLRSVKNQERNKNIIFLTIVSFIFLSSLFIITAVIYQQIKKQTFSKTNTPIKSSRILSFKGRLTDSLGNPQKETTNVQFKLYNNQTDGKILYSSGNCLVIPDNDGFFSVQIGKDCGAKLTNSIFTENPAVYLGTTINKEVEMSPRQPIGNTEYANNSLKLQGYSIAEADNSKPEATAGAEINSIPVINRSGNLVIASSNPKIWSTSGNFQLQGQVLSLTTEAGSSGDINISPDDGGDTIFTSGNVGIGTKNPLSFILEIAGNIGPHIDGKYDLGSISLKWNKIYANEIIAGNSGLQGYWQRNFEAISPANITDDLLLGDSASSSAVIKFSGKKDQNSFINSGNFGVGTSNPQEKLTIGTNSNLAVEMETPKNIIVKPGSGGKLSEGIYYFKISASDGAGATTASSEVSCTVGGTSLTRCGLWWDDVPGAVSYRIYKGSLNNQQDRYQISTINFYNYDTDDYAVLGKTPDATTAYVSKLSSSGNSWLSSSNLGLGTVNPNKGKLQIDEADNILLYLNNKGIKNSIEDKSGAKLTASGVWTDASDLNKKTNIAEITYGLSDLLKLRPVNYQWKNTGKADIGFIAQEVQQIIPEIVYGDANNLSMSYGHLTALLVKAVKEQQSQISGISEELKQILNNYLSQEEVYQENLPSPFEKLAKELFGSSGKTTAVKIKHNLLKLQNIIIENLLIAKTALIENLFALNGAIDNLTSKIIVVNEKITSPIVETYDLTATGTANLAKINANELNVNQIKAKEEKIIINLNNPPASGKGNLSKLIIQGLNNAEVATIDQEGNIITKGDITAKDASLSGQLTSSSIIADNIAGNQISASASSFIQSDIKNLTSDNLSTNIATVSGTLTANKIEAENIKTLEDNLNKMQNNINNIQSSLSKTKNASFSSEINEVQKLLAQIKNESLDSAQNYQKINSQNLSNLLTTADSGQFQSIATDLTVLGSTNLYNASIANSLSVGNFFIQDNSILSFSWELKLSALSQINFFDAAVIITKDGNITAKGEITAYSGIKTNQIKPINSQDDMSIILNPKSLPAQAGETRNPKLKIQNTLGEEVANIDASGSAYFKNGLVLEKYLEATMSAAIITASNNFYKNGLYAPAIETQAKTVGIAVLPAKANEIVIYNKKINRDSLIYLTPTSPLNQNLFVAQKQFCDNDNKENETAGNCKPYFKIAVKTPIKDDIKFNWWIVN